MPDAKRCQACHEVKGSAYFDRRLASPDDLDWVCRSCRWGPEFARVSHQTMRDRELRSRAVAIYGGRCRRCKTDSRLQFDHVYQDDRLAQQESDKALLVRIVRTGRILDDVRLQLLCHKCHREKTSIEVKLMWAAKRQGIKL